MHAPAISLPLPASLFAGHPEIAVVYLFGSYARGQARAGSDVDLAIVYRSPELGQAAHRRIADDLALAVGKAAGVERVDVIDLLAQGPLFCHQVLCESQRLYVGDEARRVDFESTTMVRAFDFRPTYEIATRGKVLALRRWLREHHDVGATSAET
jgi:predicted nucleotidyltransferase